jgi:hypothetical protein
MAPATALYGNGTCGAGTAPCLTYGAENSLESWSTRPAGKHVEAAPQTSNYMDHYDSVRWQSVGRHSADLLLEVLPDSSAPHIFFRGTRAGGAVVRFYGSVAVF